MGISGGSEVVGTCIKDIGSFVVFVISLQFRKRNSDTDIFTFAGLKKRGLCFSDKLNRRLLNAVFLVVGGIGRLSIEFNNIFTSFVSGIFDM